MNEATPKTTIDTPLLTVHKAEGASMGTWFGCALPDHFTGGDWQSEYRAARASVALIDKNYRAYLQFTGPDRVRYLNAILSNDIKSLETGRGIVSLFLNPQGRIQAEIATYDEADSLLCVSYAMIRATLVPALDKFIIMDDVTLADETEKYGTLALEGPRAASVTRSIASSDLAELQDLEFREVLVRGISCRMTKRSLAGVPGAEFLVPSENLSRLWETLEEAVASTGGRPMGYQALSALRLEQGVPWFGYDFGEKQIPHEAGLEHSHISYTKGCYTGQEIVERVRSRGQVNRVRVLLKFEGGEPPAAGTTLTADGKEIGHMTRSAFSPMLQAPIGMGYVRRENSPAGSAVGCGGTKAVVIAPPLERRSSL